MPMELLNAIQFFQLLSLYFFVSILLPALVLYPRVKGFSLPVRFLIYMTVGNFYIINLVQVLELLHCANRVTLVLATVLLAAAAAIVLNHVPVVPYCKGLGKDLRRYFLQQLGFRSLFRHRLREGKQLLCLAGRHLLCLLRETGPDLPFLLLFFLVLWKLNWTGLLENWGFGASDLPVHNKWINDLIQNQIYASGIYPMGMHCMLYYLSLLAGIPAYVSLRLFWLIQYAMTALVLLAFLRGCCRTRFLPYLGLVGYTALRYFHPSVYERFGATLPQEFGMMFILPAVFFLLAFLRERERELEAGINRVVCCSSWLLLCFSLSFSLTITSHFYDTVVALLICIGAAVGCSQWIWKREYFFRILLSGVAGVLLAVLPMAVGFLAGKPLQGSMYWAMNVIGLREYTLPVFRVICIGALAVTGLLVLWLLRLKGKKQRLTADKPVLQHSAAGSLLPVLVGLSLLALVLLLTWRCRGPLDDSFRSIVFRTNISHLLLWISGAAVVVGLCLQLVFRRIQGGFLLSVTTALLLCGIVLISHHLGLPSLMDPARIVIYIAYLLPAAVVFLLDGVLYLLLCILPEGWKKPVPLAAWLITLAGLLVMTSPKHLRVPFGGGHLEMNEAILCTTNIIRENQDQDNKWTIVSANDELQMTWGYGRHVETITFLQEIENCAEETEVTIPTDRVYFYIEKKPLNYANGYNGLIPPVSPEQAEKDLPDNSGLNAYSGPNRSITMSRMYYWAQAFQALYPNELKVYLETEDFVCYYIEQNPYRLYNFAIDYGYN